MHVPFLSFDDAKMTCDKFFMNSMVGPFKVGQLLNFHKTKVFVFLSVEAETWVGAAVTVNVMGEVAVIIPTISPNEGR